MPQSGNLNDLLCIVKKDKVMEEMVRKESRTILSSMEDIVVKAKDKGLEEEFYAEAAESLSYISETLGMSRDEAMMLALFFEQSSASRIWISNIAEMIHTSNIRIIAMMNVADSLVKKGYLRCNSRNRDEKWYTVPHEIIDCVRQNIAFTPKPLENMTFDDFFDKLGELLDEDDEMPLFIRYEAVNELVEANMHLPYCKVIKSYDLGRNERMLVHIFAHRLINEDDDIIGTHNWEDIIGSKRVVRRLLNSFKSGESDLIKKGIFEPKKEEGVRDPNYYHLTNQAKEEMFPGMDLVEKVAKQEKDLTPYTTFAAKHLYYAPHIQSQIDRLCDLLQPEQFKMVTERLSENGMRKGFAVLFHGSPGTGKTETVNQLARITGRDVMMVDVTKIKSCWVGESEQNIMALFDRYRAYVKEKDVAPILLFNEADAVLGIRQEGAQRAVDKMENSIQNIILQEMESLEGIMIATTNLTVNLDKAFERRFIYKIEFERPTVDAKMHIWKSMIPSLSDEEATSLAKEFDLSGGQIENIARKRTVELILSGCEPTYEQIREYCISETIDSRQTRSRIGF